MTSLVLTFVGDDRPGLVNAISEKIADFGGTWLESRSVRLAGKFAGVCWWMSRRKPHPARIGAGEARAFRLARFD